MKELLERYAESNHFMFLADQKKQQKTAKPYCFMKVSNFD